MSRRLRRAGRGSSMYCWVRRPRSPGPPGQLPAGFELAEQFAVLPGRPGRRLLVSLNARRGACSALTSYNALRSPRRRLARRVLGAGLRAGIAQPLLPGKVDVGTAVTASREQLASEYADRTPARAVRPGSGRGGHQRR